MIDGHTLNLTTDNVRLALQLYHNDNGHRLLNLIHHNSPNLRLNGLDITHKRIILDDVTYHHLNGPNFVVFTLRLHAWVISLTLGLNVLLLDVKADLGHHTLAYALTLYNDTFRLNTRLNGLDITLNGLLYRLLDYDILLLSGLDITLELYLLRDDHQTQTLGLRYLLTLTLSHLRTLVRITQRLNVTRLLGSVHVTKHVSLGGFTAVQTLSLIRDDSSVSTGFGHLRSATPRKRGEHHYRGNGNTEAAAGIPIPFITIYRLRSGRVRSLISTCKLMIINIRTRVMTMGKTLTVTITHINTISPTISVSIRRSNATHLTVPTRRKMVTRRRAVTLNVTKDGLRMVTRIFPGLQNI